ncbi:histidine phosphatase family protein [Nitrosomonas marina]|uniref:Alpha-ribazole phosphatase n=1 Tax=Nitrosomonas marina TaxID=917 RepID=A0A1H8IN62_9PROT|nr:histidine phosphatase family protein [Nitrosomonas marina]SEN70390.1 alpha-ribazole phosphatase [Nitrosomonas marina]
MAETTVAQIDLLRHGETVSPGRFYGSTEAHLSDTGWQQMQRRVAQMPQQWNQIVTSPLYRCSSFAHALAENYDIPLVEEARFREIHFGIWEGRSATEIMQNDADALTLFWKNPFDHSPPESEPLADFSARVIDAWQDILSQCVTEHNQNKRRILLIVHGGVMRVLFCHIHNKPLTHLLEYVVPFAMLQSIELKRSSNIFCVNFGTCYTD